MPFLSLFFVSISLFLTLSLPLCPSLLSLCPPFSLFLYLYISFSFYVFVSFSLPIFVSFFLSLPHPPLSLYLSILLSFFLNNPFRSRIHLKSTIHSVPFESIKENLCSSTLLLVFVKYHVNECADGTNTVFIKFSPHCDCSTLKTS